MAKKGFTGFDPTKRAAHSKATDTARAFAAEEETVRLNLEVPKSLRAELQKRAIDEGLSMKELGTKILQEYLNG